MTVPPTARPTSIYFLSSPRSLVRPRRQLRKLHGHVDEGDTGKYSASGFAVALCGAVFLAYSLSLSARRPRGSDGLRVLKQGHVPRTDLDALSTAAPPPVERRIPRAYIGVGRADDLDCH